MVRAKTERLQRAGQVTAPAGLLDLLLADLFVGPHGTFAGHRARQTSRLVADRTVCDTIAGISDAVMSLVDVADPMDRRVATVRKRNAVHAASQRIANNGTGGIDATTTARMPAGQAESV